MTPISSFERADRQKGGAWAVDLIMQGAPPVRHLVVVDASKKSALLNEPAPTFAQVNAILDRAFKRLGPPAEIMTDGAVEYSDDSFRKLFASFGVRHIVASFAEPLIQGAVERHARSKSKGKIT
jgi:hypothetical protein